MNKNVEQALVILKQVVDLASAEGIFKKAQDAATVVQALSIVEHALAPQPEESLIPVKNVSPGKKGPKKVSK